MYMTHLMAYIQLLYEEGRNLNDTFMLIRGL